MPTTMYVKMRKMDILGSTCMVDVFKLTKVEELHKIIHEKMEVSPDCQILLFRGKILINGQTFYDYDINFNDIIQLMVRPPKVLVESEVDDLPEKEEKEIEPMLEDVNEVIEEEAESELYKVRDIIDAKDVGETCAWFEQYPDDSDSKCKVEDIRSRARFTYKFDKLEVGINVFVNHNTQMQTSAGASTMPRLSRSTPQKPRNLLS